MPRTNISGGSKWEPVVGYSRLVRVGPLLCVSGTTAMGEDGKIVGVDDPYLQTKTAILSIEAALAKAGASLNDVVRTRIFVTNIDDWDDVALAHNEYFGDIRPATTLVEVKKLIERDLLVEIEADAYLG